MLTAEKLGHPVAEAEIRKAHQQLDHHHGTPAEMTWNQFGGNRSNQNQMMPQNTNQLMSMLPMIFSNMMGNQMQPRGSPSNGGGKNKRQNASWVAPTTDSKETCTTCNRMHSGECRHKHLLDEACTVCGGSGHTRFTCHHKDKMCKACGKKGHTEKVCRGGKPPPSKAAAAASPATSSPTVSTGQQSSWFCTPCKTFRDASAKQCPKCHKKQPADTNDADPLGPLKKIAIESNARWHNHLPGSDPVPLTVVDQERVKNKIKFAKQIADLEALEHREPDEEAMLLDRKEKLKKLEMVPTTTNYAQDQVNISIGLKDIEVAMEKNTLIEQQNLQDHQKESKELKETIQHQKEKLREEYDQKLLVLDQTLVRDEQVIQKKIQEVNTRIQEITKTGQEKKKEFEHSLQNLRATCPKESLIVPQQAAAATTAATPGATMVPVAAGAIIHSNNVDAATARDAVMQGTGLPKDQAEAAVQAVLCLLNKQALQVQGPAPVWGRCHTAAGRRHATIK